MDFTGVLLCSAANKPIVEAALNSDPNTPGGGIANPTGVQEMSQ